MEHNFKYEEALDGIPDLLPPCYSCNSLIASMKLAGILNEYC